MIHSRLIAMITIITALFLFGCGGPPSPLDEIRAALKGVPTYSVVLDDMREEGDFFKSYYHTYQVIIEEKTTKTAWREVSEKYFQRYAPFLGMTIWSKKDGKEGESIGPPGYEYVGDSKYGRWNRDSSGQSFWVFYGQYRLISDLLGGGRIYRGSYDTYNNYRTQGRPYYGTRNQYGTGGSITKAQKPNFYSRRMSRQRAKSASFSDKVNRRTGRTRSNVRGRSGGWGK